MQKKTQIKMVRSILLILGKMISNVLIGIQTVYTNIGG